MKKWLSLCLTALLLFGLCFSALPVSAAGTSVQVTASAAAATVGETVTVTVKYTADSAIGSLDGTLSYDAALMEYVSLSGADGSGNAGVTRISYFDRTGNPSKTLTFTVKFKAKAVGTCQFSMATSELVDWETYAPLGTPSGNVSVNVKNPSLSGNANLTELYISSGKLSPAFSSSVTEYQIVVPYSTTVLTVSAKTADANAKLEVVGSKELKVGKNTRVVEVTAPNGTVKSYTLNITRQENSGTENPANTTEPSSPAALTEVTVGEKKLLLAKDLTGVTLPLGYTQTTATVNGTEFPAAQDASKTVLLLYLTDEKGENGAFYVYETANMTFFEFCFATVDAGLYTFLTPDGNAQLPDGFVQASVKIQDQDIPAWTFSDPAMQEYFLVYALSPAGHIGWYQYDSVEGTLQRYTAGTAASVPVDGTDTLSAEKPGIIARVRAFFAGLISHFGVLRFSLICVGMVLLLLAGGLLIFLLTRRGDRQQPRH